MSLHSAAASDTRHEPTLREQIHADFVSHGRRWGAQGFWAMSVYRFGRWRYRFNSPIVRKPLSAIYHVMFKVVQIVTGIEFPCEVKVGRNFVIDHFGGIIISGYTTFGDDCRIRQGVSIGLASVDDPCSAQIGNNVDIGCGAKLLGRIVIGNDVSIGANAVVVEDVPSDSIAVGVPAVVRSKKQPPKLPVQQPASQAARVTAAA